MHFCTGHVAIGGDTRNIMYRDEFDPVSWPEIEVLREIHGFDAVTDVKPFVDVNQSPRAERDRLAMKYGDEVLATRWGGKNPPTELVAPRATIKPDVVWKNPLSRQTEKTTANGSHPYTIPAEARPIAEVVGNYALREAEASPEPVDEMYRDDPEDLNPTVVEVEETPKALLKAGKR